MYLSQVVLNPRHRETYRLLADIYAQHRFVMSAFPDKGETAGNSDGGRSDSKVLYRIDTAPEGCISFLVQSAQNPDWKKTGTLHAGVICKMDTKQDARAFEAGTRMRFRLRANPTVCRVNRDAKGARNPKREGIFQESEQLGWLVRAAERGGFAVNLDAVLATPRGKREGYKPAQQDAKAHKVTCYAVDFDGTLIVTDQDRFVETLHVGMGRGRAWGCGLLSVMRC